MNCIVENCENPIFVKKWGLCSKHYTRQRRHNDVDVCRSLPLRTEYLDTSGYVLVRGAGHPKAHNGWIRQHIVALEAKIGRFLGPGESVHHKNGDRTDNHPDNLELWTTNGGKQHPGQRMEDIIAWAEDVVALYGSQNIEVGMVMC